ncbi:MAG TPA: SDR family oxidoreductase [Acidimicrobiia bacterium]|nr:SDR family oxidoreductase [Acidimicrobiia bacterium]
MSATPVGVVTGAASGIGAATAHWLAAHGLDVVCCDIDDGPGRAVADEVGATYVSLDVGDAAAWADLHVRLRDEGRPVTRAVLNAGMLTRAEPLAFLDVTPERFQRVRAVNLDGVVLGILALAPLIARHGGSIVATASLAGLGPYEADPIYAATKHGIVGLVRSAAPQLAAAGVRLHAICPGGVDTGLLPRDRKAAISAAGRPMLDPAEVAAAIGDLLDRADHGLVHTIVHGRGSERYEFRGVPGPRP